MRKYILHSFFINISFSKSGDMRTVYISKLRIADSQVVESSLKYESPFVSSETPRVL